MNNSTKETMFSSKSVEWSTPQDFYAKLDRMFGPFTLDPCSDGENNKTQKFFTKDDNGLQQDWSGHTVFMNPPYGRGIGEWIHKAYVEGSKPNTKVVCLIPARTDTRYWHDYVMRAQIVLFVRGRLKFGDSKNSAPFPSAVVLFDGKINSLPAMGSLERE